MTHDSQNNIQKVSLIGRILSIEAFLMVMGIASLAYGIINNLAVNIFWGCVIIPGVFVLHKVRKKDWEKHWQEMEAEHRALEEREVRMKNAAAARRGDVDEK
ncbi:MAG: hypothetical protein PHP95_08290 [Desulfuromonadaceae bacterium]|nr:hypothetical protein [Desulfuromonadaceae bacterium]MDD2848442.1 hypothetical protein [Desulfuromonadaceae bacterium]MDD4129929.1 hypothetical protein [Desulfuromonadaceae bacterium]